jgi:hypothetical protein
MARRFTPVLTRVLSWALLLALAFAPVTSRAADPDAGQDLKLERVVMLMRHGIRPPTKAAVTPPGITAGALASMRCAVRAPDGARRRGHTNPGTLRS